MLNSSKRNFLFKTSSVIALFIAGSVNKLFAEWQESLFSHNNIDQVVSSLTNNVSPVNSEEIHIKAPEIAENGAVVPVTVDTSIPNVTNIAIIVDNNPSPLTSSFDFNPQLKAYISTRVKIAKSSSITALVSTKENKFFTRSKNIKVTIGGCGG